MPKKTKTPSKKSDKKTEIKPSLSLVLPALKTLIKGDFPADLPVSEKPQDELSELFALFNQMVFSLKKQKAEQKQLLQEKTRAVEASKDHMTKIISFVPIALFALDRENRLTNWNKKAEEITGYKASSVVGKKFADLGFFHLGGGSKIIAGGQSIIRPKGKQDIFIRKYVDFLKDDQGQYLGAIATFEDVTAENKRESEQAKRQEELEKVNRLMVGRELKMIEMKKDIQQFKDKIQELKQLIAKSKASALPKTSHSSKKIVKTKKVESTKKTKPTKPKPTKPKSTKTKSTKTKKG